MNEHEGGLSFVYKNKGDALEESIGRWGSVPGNIAMGTPEAIAENFSEEKLEYLKQKYADIPWKGQVEVYINHSPLFKQLKRLYQNERRSNIFARVLIGTPYTLLWTLYGRVFRSTLYNNFSESVQTYHPNPTVTMHEIGHAENYDRIKFPTLWWLARSVPGLDVLQEWIASRNAMKHLDPGERKNASKILEPALSTYITPYILGLFAFLEFREPLNTVLFSTLPEWLYPYIVTFVSTSALFAGHLHSRRAKKNIFYNKTEESKEQTSMLNLSSDIAFAV